MSRYASETRVSTESSEAEIKRTLIRYGADQFYSGWDNDRNLAVLGFRIVGRMVKMILPLPNRDDREYTHTPSRGTLRSPQQAAEAWEQACRQRWRALTLIVKAKLEAVESGISTIEREFLADMLLPSGQTLHEWVGPQIEDAYTSRLMPRSLPMLPAAPEESEAAR